MLAAISIAQFLELLTRAFLSAGVLCVLIVFFSRVIKSARLKREEVLVVRIRQILNKIIINGDGRGSPTGESAFRFYVEELDAITGGSEFARNVLIKQLLELKKNLRGASRIPLIDTYRALSLFRTSLRKLGSISWPTRAKGIHELTEMEHKDAIAPISTFLFSSNRALREESVMALVRLEDEPLSFLKYYPYDLSEWQRLNIHHYLSKLDVNMLPQFSQWFNHRNATIALFAMGMTRVFRQRSSLPLLAKMLYSDRPAIVIAAVDGIAELEAFEYRDEIIRLAKHAWNFEKVVVRAVHCLGKIGDPIADADALALFARHPSYAVRFHAVTVLYRWGTSTPSRLESLCPSNEWGVSGIVHHVSEPLLS